MNGLSDRYIGESGRSPLLLFGTSARCPESNVTMDARTKKAGAAHLWYKDAIIYQLHVKSFFDSNNDGIGDFPGLISKLDYIADLGVNAIWLLPFYPSPRFDDGYDISGYRDVHADYGRLADFRQFVRAAHARDIRVITDLEVNHTSDQHPWFQRARHAKPGSTCRDFYVWSDDDQKYAGTRIILVDTERSNWTWDAAAGAYYWHRFSSHQPDLNFDKSPGSKSGPGRDAILATAWRRWSAAGFRAVPC
jgi:maltose alpha-D-glucosyltransferase/alpha-amylase